MIPDLNLVMIQDLLDGGRKTALCEGNSDEAKQVTDVDPLGSSSDVHFWVPR